MHITYGGEAMRVLGDEGRGNQADYALGTTLGWDAFDVVRWHAVAAISRPFEYDIVLARPARNAAVEIHELVGSGGTFRIAGAAGWRSIHGLIAEAEVIDATATLLLYRVLLVPHLWRSLHRRHCRTFVERGLCDILREVLTNRAPDGSAGAGGLAELTDRPPPPNTTPDFDGFEEPIGRFRFALADDERATRPRRFVVQYNETDFAFASRLLEAEGLSYLFEHTAKECVMTVTDRPGTGSLFDRDEEHELVGMDQSGTSRGQEVLRAWRPVRRLRSTAVTMRDYAWRKSSTLLQATAQGAAGAADLLEHYEYPASDEDDPSQPGQAPAAIQLERYQIEQALSEGLSTVRSHEPGGRFRLHDRSGLRSDAELLVASVETYAAELLPEGTVLDVEPFGFVGTAPGRGAFFESRFQSVPAELRYRPERATPPPRIDGVQTAQVTADEVDGKEPMSLHSDEFGRIRVRFPWDERPADGTPSSKWIRVSQPWAGCNWGALYVPRVGQEVLVAFERGEPDRPMVVGRLYNEQNPPPYREANTTKTTVKSESVGAQDGPAEGFNELRFDDQVEAEQIYLHAQRNLDEVVLADHTTSVGGNQANSVAGSQSNSVGGKRDHGVGATESVNVRGDRTTKFGSNETHGVDINRTTGVGGKDELDAGTRVATIQGADSLRVKADRNVRVDGNQIVDTMGNYHSHAYANHTFKSTNLYSNQAGEFHVHANDLWLDVCGASLRMSGGKITLDNGAGASLAMVGGLIVVTSGNVVSISGAHAITSGGATVLNSGGDTTIAAGGNVNASGAEVKLND
jgi:type VI secretion system secreted protein VgrG